MAEPKRSCQRFVFYEVQKMTYASINARVAYAFFLADDGSSRWTPLCLAAIDRFEEGVNSADASFLLHMISEMKLT